MIAKSFIDTNVFVYSFAKDEPEKDKIATELIEKLISDDNLVLSAQVLSEFTSVVTKKIKNPFSLDKTRNYIELLEESSAEIVPIEYSMVIQAIGLCEKNKLQYWDGLILASALHAECRVLYSEDLQHGQKFSELEVINPFLK